MKNICELIKDVLRGKRYCLNFDDCLDLDLYYEGIVDKEQLSELIQLAISHSEFEPLLCHVVEKFINSESVDLNNFEALLNSKWKHSHTMLWSLCHTPLSFYQMQILFDKHYQDFPEIVCNIISMIYINDCFTEYDLEFYLNRVRSVKLKSIVDISALVSSVPTNNKTSLLTKYIQ